MHRARLRSRLSRTERVKRAFHSRHHRTKPRRDFEVPRRILAAIIFARTSLLLLFFGGANGTDGASSRAGGRSAAAATAPAPPCARLISSTRHEQTTSHGVTAASSDRNRKRNITRTTGGAAGRPSPLGSRSRSRALAHSRHSGGRHRPGLARDFLFPRAPPASLRNGGGGGDDVVAGANSRRRSLSLRVAESRRPCLFRAVRRRCLSAGTARVE